jgi:hypothetical protein
MREKYPLSIRPGLLLTGLSCLIACLFAGQSVVAKTLLLESIGGETVAAVFAELHDLSPERSIIFEGSVHLESVVSPSPFPVTPRRDLNFAAEWACLVIRQFAADGRELAVDASLARAAPGQHRVSIEAAPVSGAVRAILECRLSGLKARAQFAELYGTAAGAELFLPAPARITSRPGMAPAISINGTNFPPLVVHGQNLETSADVSASIRDIKLPYQHGIRLFSYNGWFDGVTDHNTRNNLETLVSVYPEAHFLLRVWLGPRETFFKDYPEERMSFDDATHFAGVAPPDSLRWQRYRAANIRRMVLDLRKSPDVKRLAGIVPMYYVTGEWQIGDFDGPYRPGTRQRRMWGYSDTTQAAFAEWSLLQYGDLSALNNRWQSDYDSPAAIAVPSVKERLAGDLGGFRNPHTQAKTIDFTRFTAHTLTDAIINSSRDFQQAFHGRLLSGPFYGHILEHAWSAAGVQQQGHFAIHRLLESPLIDFHGSPYSYNNDNRFAGTPMDTNAVLDSAQLHAKLAFLEEDTYTHIAKPPEGFIAPGAHQRPPDLPTTMQVLMRNFGTSIARGYIHYWMGLLEDGRFDLPEIWQGYQPLLQWLHENPLRPVYRPQIALVIDEQAIPLLAENDRSIVGRWLYELRSFLARVDTTMGIYLQSDLDRIPDSVRMLILALPYQLTEETAGILHDRWMRDGRTLVFCHLPDFFTESGLSPQPAAITGIRLRVVDSPLQPISTLTNAEPLASFAGEVMGHPFDRAVTLWRPNATLEPLHPYVVVEDEDATVLARYNNDPQNRPSMALKRMSGWTSIFTSVHSLSPDIWRTLAHDAGAHLYLDDPIGDFEQPDVIEAADDFLMVISGRDGVRSVSLPRKAKVSVLYGDAWRTDEATQQFEFHFKAKEPVLFFLQQVP